MALQLTASGLSVKTEEEIRLSLVSRAIALFGAKTRTDAGGFVGDMIDLMKIGFRLLNEAALDLYSAFNRNTATGTNLDNLAAVIGITRAEASKSTCVATLTGTALTVIPAGTRCRVPSGSIWALRDDATIPAGGTLTGVVLESDEDGPVTVAISDIDTIVDVVAGWTTVDNTTASTDTLGRLRETDSQLRARMARTIGGRDGSSETKMRAELEAIESVISASVRSNPEETTDVDGVPPHRYWANVYPNTANTTEIAEVLWRTQPAGIKGYGSQSATVTDDQGYPRIVYWDWVTNVRMYVEANVTTGPRYPSNGDTLVAEAVEEWGALLFPGDDIYPIQLACYILEHVDGVLSVEILVEDSSPPGNSSPIAIGSNQIATFASGDVTVT